jgi:hypothetical protein
MALPGTISDIQREVLIDGNCFIPRWGKLCSNAFGK